MPGEIHPASASGDGTSTNHAMCDSVVVLGCGYLGTTLLRELNSRYSQTGVLCDMVAITRGERRHLALNELSARCLAWDVVNSNSPNSGDMFRVSPQAVIYTMLTPSAYGPDPARDAERIAARLNIGELNKVVLVSSTGVFADAGDTLIDESGALNATDPRALRLQTIEQAWRQCCAQIAVVRLAGIYGPDRVIGQRALKGAEDLPGTGEEWLNLIHVADAARALLATTERALPDNTHPLLISDGQPARRKDYYASVADLLGTNKPVFSAGKVRRSGSRKLNPKPSWRRLGITPKYEDFRDGVAEALSGERITRE